MTPSEAHEVCKRNGIKLEYGTLLEAEIAPVLVRLEAEIAALKEVELWAKRALLTFQIMNEKRKPGITNAAFQAVYYAPDRIKTAEEAE